MLNILMQLCRDLRGREGRFAALQWLLSECPGEFGVRVRSLVYRSYFRRVGTRFRIGQHVLIHHGEFITAGDNVSIGEANIMEGAGGVEIGSCVMFGPAGRILSGERGPDRLLGNGKVTIGNNVWIGAGSCLLPGAWVGEGGVVSAGSVVGDKAVPRFTLVAGNPARVIGRRYTDQRVTDDSAELAEP